MPYMDLMDSQSNYPEFFANCHIPILPQRSLLPMVDLQDSTPNSSTAPVSPAKGSVQMMSCMKGLYCNYYKFSILPKKFVEICRNIFSWVCVWYTVRLYTIEPWLLIRDTIGVVFLILQDRSILYTWDKYFAFRSSSKWRITVGQSPAEPLPPLGGNVATSLPCQDATPDNTTSAMIIFGDYRLCSSLSFELCCFYVALCHWSWW